jgi:superfamily I DNA/RNA helicase
MIDPRTEPGYLTADQRKVVEAPGNIVLTACPGSGKTRTAAARFVVQAGAGDRVAATSYTNVGVVVGAEHFVGTLHGFLLQFVFRPFAHLVMHTSAAPRLVDSEAVPEEVVLHGDNRLRAAVAGFRFRPDGSLCFTGQTPRRMSREEVTAAGQAAALRLKMQVARSGRATYDDTMFWSLQVLRRFPAVAAAVAGRFDELVVDESQDTSELQLACLEELCRTDRLRSLVLVGDVEQSIYSFQGASPLGLADLVSQRNLTPMSLVENHRSSQHLCNAAVHFCNRHEPDRAVGEHADRSDRPEILFYEPMAPPSVVESFRLRLDDLGITTDGAAVLARNGDLVDALNGATGSVKCHERPQLLGRAVQAHRESTLMLRQLQAIERIVSRTAWGPAAFADLDLEQRRRLRPAAMRLLAEAAPLDLALDAWIKATARALRDVAAGLVDVPACRAGDVLRSAAGQDQVVAQEVFTYTRAGLLTQTVHEVKGQSRDAVLVVARPRGSSRRPSEADTWTAHLRGTTLPVDQEERRILFVALTRARRYAAIGLPSDTASATVDSFVRAGFVVSPARPAQSRT